ncbi:MAG: RHS repeat protein, partial [Caldisericia bacterium]|nr:RHS repeat protein [Caldisericia bacterium]
NPIHSFSITTYSMDQLIPFGEDTLSVSLTYDDVFTTTQTNVPFQTPRPISNNCFGTYSFPVLNGDPNTGADIYTNNALTVVLPDNDTTPPGVIPAAPYLDQSIPYINLGTTNPHNTVDISVLVNTPISSTVYPNYPIVSFTSVMEANASLMSQPNYSVQKPLSSLPMVQTVSARDIGTNGELETKAFLKPVGVDYPLAMNVGNGDLCYPPGGPGRDFNNVGTDGESFDVHVGTAGETFDVKGCLSNEAPVTSYYLDPCEPHAAFTPNDDNIIPDPRDPNLIPGNDHILSSTATGSIFALQKVLDPNQTTIPTVTTYYNPKVTNSKLICDTSKPATERFELQTPTKDISRWYNTDGKIQKITSSIGGELNYNYNAQGQLTSVEDGYSNRSMTYIYDTYDRLVEIRNPLNEQVQYQYNANNQITAATDSQGRTYHYNFDTTTNLLTSVTVSTEVNTAEKPLWSIVAPSLDPCDPNYISIVAPQCQEKPTEYRMDPNTLVASITDPSGNEYNYGFYHDGTVAYIEDEFGHKKTFEPDSEHASPAIKEESLDDGDPNTIDEKKTYTYDYKRNLTSVTDADGNAATITYNDYNKPITRTDREGNTTTINYTQDGSTIQSVVSPSGQTATVQYNANQQATSKTYTWKTGQTATYTYTYDANGYIDTITDPLNQVTDRDYDALGRLVKTTDPLGRYSEVTYNPGGSPSQISYSNSTGTQSKDVDMTYDDLGQLTSVSDPKGSLTSYAYDNYGRLTSTTDALSNTTSFVYDIMDQVTSVTDAKNRI